MKDREMGIGIIDLVFHWEYTMSTGRGVPSIRQVVVYFYPKDDNKEHELIDSHLN